MDQFGGPKASNEYPVGFAWATCTPFQWKPGKMPAFSDDRWELYDLTRDYSQATDLAAQHPDKLAELQALFDREAEKNSVFPLDDRGPSRAINARPTIMGDRSSITLEAGAIRMPEDIIRSTFNRSYSITAEFDPSATGATEGVLFAAGGYFAGLSLYIQDGRPKFTYNYFGSIEATVALGFSADEGIDVGMDTGTPATDTYDGTFPFTGTIEAVTIELR